MKFFGRLMLVTVLLMAQMSWASVACGCKPLRPPLSVKPTSVCKMSGKADCACCLKGSPGQDQGKVGAADRCEVQAANAQAPPPAALAFSPVCVDFAIPHRIVISSGYVAAEHVTPQHLVVFRIRPPDPKLHGLRAPPTR